ncbi:MAG: DUF2142 domain-containing protein [Bacteroidales bacterium]|nr:DUF2142 domain-containing protein [Bacteroidales bacterium]
MNQTTRTIIGVLVLLLSVVIISVVRINPPTTTPARSTETRDASVLEGLFKGEILTQEFTVRRKYVSGVDLVFSHGGRYNSNDNTLMLLDTNYRTLYQERFSSVDIKEGALTSFRFSKSVFIGKGNRVYLCLFSNDGTQANTISPLLNPSDSIGPLYVSRVIGDDLPSSIKNITRKYKGSLMIRTYGTDQDQFWLMKIFLYFLGVCLSGLIVWFTWFRTTLARIRILPEWVFLAIAIPVSTVFAFITPPLQVPDEGSHFLKVNEIAEFNLFNKNKTGPVSILKLDSAFGDLHFLAGKKTTVEEITKHLGVKLEPEKRAPISPPSYTVPYLPQALGVFIAKVLGASPLVMMYLGRLFNMLISVIILFYAIRIIPQFKWTFLLLALMPKTLFLLGSLSYDSFTISLSFFTIAVFFHYAFACERNLSFKDLAVMAFLVLLLLLCKPPYFILGLLFFFIPRRKFGYLYKYIMIAIGVVVIAGSIFMGWTAMVGYFSGNATTEQVSPEELSAYRADLPVIRPEDQIKLIKADIPGYLKLIVKSGFVHYRSYIIRSFVGVLGWIDVHLPNVLTSSYLLLILFSALVFYDKNVTLGISKKTLLLLLLVITFVIVETAMYIYATRPGRDRVFGVQGRYFIPMAPLFFMLFYNKYLNPALNVLFSLRRKEYKAAKVKVKPAIYEEILEKEQLFNKYLYLLITGFCVFTLLYSIYITLIRYYNI